MKKKDVDLVSSITLQVTSTGFGSVAAEKIGTVRGAAVTGLLQAVLD